MAQRRNSPASGIGSSPQAVHGLTLASLFPGTDYEGTRPPLGRERRVEATCWDYCTSKNILFGVPQTGHLSGASPTSVWPQTGQT
jgi:hypothetical protein